LKEVINTQKTRLQTSLQTRTEKQLKNADILPGLYNLIKPQDYPKFLHTLRVRARGYELAGYTLDFSEKTKVF
jgi:hypothetical protein